MDNLSNSISDYFKNNKKPEEKLLSDSFTESIKKDGNLDNEKIKSLSKNITQGLAPKLKENLINTIEAKQIQLKNQVSHPVLKFVNRISGSLASKELELGFLTHLSHQMMMEKSNATGRSPDLSKKQFTKISLENQETKLNDPSPNSITALEIEDETSQQQVQPEVAEKNNPNDQPPANIKTLISLFNKPSQRSNNSNPPKTITKTSPPPYEGETEVRASIPIQAEEQSIQPQPNDEPLIQWASVPPKVSREKIDMNPNQTTEIARQVDKTATSIWGYLGQVLETLSEIGGLLADQASPLKGGRLEAIDKKTEPKMSKEPRVDTYALPTQDLREDKEYNKTESTAEKATTIASETLKPKTIEKTEPIQETSDDDWGTPEQERTPFRTIQNALNLPSQTRFESPISKLNPLPDKTSSKESRLDMEQLNALLERIELFQLPTDELKSEIKGLQKWIDEISTEIKIDQENVSKIEHGNEIQKLSKKKDDSEKDIKKYEKEIKILEANIESLTKNNKVKVKLTSLFGEKKEKIIEIPLYTNKELDDINKNLPLGNKLGNKFSKEFQLALAKENKTEKEDLLKSEQAELKKIEEKLESEEKKLEEIRSSGLVEKLQEELKIKRTTKTKFTEVLKQAKELLKAKEKTYVDDSSSTTVPGHEIDEAIESHGDLRIFMKDQSGNKIYERLKEIINANDLEPMITDQTPINDPSISDPARSQNLNSSVLDAIQNRPPKLKKTERSNKSSTLNKLNSATPAPTASTPPVDSSQKVDGEPDQPIKLTPEDKVQNTKINEIKIFIEKMKEVIQPLKFAIDRHESLQKNIEDKEKELNETKEKLKKLEMTRDNLISKQNLPSITMNVETDRKKSQSVALTFYNVDEFKRIQDERKKADKTPLSDIFTTEKYLKYLETNIEENKKSLKELDQIIDSKKIELLTIEDSKNNNFNFNEYKDVLAKKNLLLTHWTLTLNDYMDKQKKYFEDRQKTLKSETPEKTSSSSTEESANEINALIADNPAFKVLLKGDDENFQDHFVFD